MDVRGLGWARRKWIMEDAGEVDGSVNVEKGGGLFGAVVGT